MSTKRYKIVRPKSLTDPVYADFEYLLMWKGRSGGYLKRMFYDATIEHNISGNVVNLDDEDLIKSINKEEKRTIVLQTFDLTLTDKQALESIYAASVVFRIKQDGTLERYAPPKNRFNFRLKQGRYEAEIELAMPNKKVYR